MKRSAAAPSPSTVEPYSPLLRTGLILTGTGTAGAYHAGVLRALHEAGVKIDVVGGHGVGVVGALFAAVDGAQRLWEESGFWRSEPVRHLYSWRPMARAAVWAVAASIGIVAIPIGVVAAALIVFPIDFAVKMVGLGGIVDFADAYLRMLASAFSAGGFPTWLPRLVVLVLGLTGLLAVLIGWSSGNARSGRGPVWWRLIRPPLSSKEAAEHCWRVMWDLLRGAAQLKAPTALDLGRRYTDLVSENLGQPGFKELVLIAHDIDAQRDVVFALVGEARRRDLVRRPTIEATEERRSEVFDLSGVGREYLAPVVAGALSIPIVSEPGTLTFAPDAYWRGEAHRLCHRTAGVGRLIEEFVGLGVEQVVVVSAAPDALGPHRLSRMRLEGRARFGEYLQSSEAAAVRDATRLGSALSAIRLFTIRPAHNPLGPFDFRGGYDDQSDRRFPLGELMARGYEDAYHQFVEPVVGASGELLKISAP
jgi:hypothetical protein